MHLPHFILMVAEYCLIPGLSLSRVQCGLNIFCHLWTELDIHCVHLTYNYTYMCQLSPLACT